MLRIGSGVGVWRGWNIFTLNSQHYFRQTEKTSAGRSTWDIRTEEAARRRLYRLSHKNTQTNKREPIHTLPKRHMSLSRMENCQESSTDSLWQTNVTFVLWSDLQLSFTPPSPVCACVCVRVRDPLRDAACPRAAHWPWFNSPGNRGGSFPHITIYESSGSSLWLLKLFLAPLGSRCRRYSDTWSRIKWYILKSKRGQKDKND